MRRYSSRSSALWWVVNGRAMRAAVERLQHGRLDLQEALAVEIGAHGGDDAGAVGEQLAGLLVCDQVELAAALARLHVDQAGVLVGRRAQRLAEDLEAVHAQRQLAVALRSGAPSTPSRSPRSSDSSCLKRVGAEHVGARVQLDLAAAVDEIEERGLAGAAARGDAPGDAVGILGLLPHLQLLVGGAHLCDRLDVREGVGGDLGALRAQALRLGAALGDQLGQAVA